MKLFFTMGGSIKFVKISTKNFYLVFAVQIKSVTFAVLF